MVTYQRCPQAPGAASTDIQPRRCPTNVIRGSQVRMKVPGPEQQSAEPSLNGPGHKVSTGPIGALSSAVVPGPDEGQNLPNPALVMVPRWITATPHQIAQDLPDRSAWGSQAQAKVPDPELRWRNRHSTGPAPGKVAEWRPSDSVVRAASTDVLSRGVGGNRRPQPVPRARRRSSVLAADFAHQCDKSGCRSGPAAPRSPVTARTL